MNFLITFVYFQVPTSQTRTRKSSSVSVKNHDICPEPPDQCILSDRVNRAKFSFKSYFFTKCLNIWIKTVCQHNWCRWTIAWKKKLPEIRFYLNNWERKRKMQLHANFSGRRAFKKLKCTPCDKRCISNGDCCIIFCEICMCSDWVALMTRWHGDMVIWWQCALVNPRGGFAAAFSSIIWSILIYSMKHRRCAYTVSILPNTHNIAIMLLCQQQLE